MNLTDGIIKRNYLDDNTKEDYKNNHMTSRKLIQCTGKSKGDINILVVNRRKREETGQVYKKA